MIEYACSACSEPMESPGSMVDKYERCPACGHQQKVPSLGTLMADILDKAPPDARSRWARSSPDEQAEPSGSPDGIDWSAPLLHYFTDIVGVAHENADGSSRADIIRQCDRLETLELEHEADNPHDPNAIRVCRSDGGQLGYLSRYVARHVAEEMAADYSFVGFFAGFTGGQEIEEDGEDADANALGAVRILLVRVADGITDAEAQRYLDDAMGEIRERVRGYSFGGPAG